MIKRVLTSPHGVAALVAVFAFAVYLKTLAPGVHFIDSGELAAVACTLGIAHPTGYPLFTLIGWLFSNLPIASEEIVRLNMMSAFSVLSDSSCLFISASMCCGLRNGRQCCLQSDPRRYDTRSLWRVHVQDCCWHFQKHIGLPRSRLKCIHFTYSSFP